MTNMFQSKARLVAFVIASAFVTIGSLALSAAAAPAKPSAAGAASKPASPAGVVGWRGDGTGRFPSATPPTEWYLKESGESKNILWKTKLPCYTWSTPIIVGDKVFTRSEPYDLICMNKNTGKILWIRSHPAFVALTADEKRAPGLKDVATMVAQLQKLNDEFVAKGWSQDLFMKRYDLQKKINEASANANEKYTLPPDWYVESWTGYTAPTPCSDGKFVYLVSGSGVTACYDLDGNLKWSHYNQVTKNEWGEHGQAGSPTVVGDKLLVSGNNKMQALNTTTGAEVWQKPGGGGGYAILPFVFGGTEYAIIGGNYVRVNDGTVMLARTGDMPGNQCVIADDMVFYMGGRASFYKLGEKPDGGLSVTPLIPAEYNRVNLPTGDNPKVKVDPSITGFVTGSPLYHDGLLYNVGNFGKLFVVDTHKTTQSDTLVYSSFPPFDFKNGYARRTPGMGIGASPAFAGKHIYMIDSSNCMIVMEPGREYKQVAKNTIDCTVPEWPPLNTKQGYYTGPHHEQTEASPIFDGSRIYIRGEQFLYCVGEK